MSIRELRLVIRGKAFAQSRPRANFRKRRVYAGESQGLEAYKQIISYEAHKRMVGTPLFREALGIEINFFFRIPKKPRKPNTWYTSRPDLDNLEKAVMDSLTHIVYIDDSLICKKLSTKQYCFPGEERTEIFIYHVEDEREIKPNESGPT